MPRNLDFIHLFDRHYIHIVNDPITVDIGKLSIIEYHLQNVKSDSCQNMLGMRLFEKIINKVLTQNSFN